MVFSSLPPYLDHYQQQSHQAIRNSTNPLFEAPPQQPATPHGGGGGGGSIRPGSMAERARMANIPAPEAALRCPRCESTNTKFCYFNNYSLSQPRHFCKNCRRYWTRGGAMRNVPVGGGCRRNKKTKNSNSKAPAANSGDRQNNNTNSPTAVGSTNSVAPTAILGLLPQLRLPQSQLPDCNYTADIGLKYGGITAENFAGGNESWRLQNLQFFGGGMEAAPVNYQFHQGGESSHQIRPKIGNSMISQRELVKMEENRQMDLPRQLFGGIMPRGYDSWIPSSGGTPTGWPDLSGFSSSPSTNPL